MSVRFAAALCLCSALLPVSAARAATCAEVFESIGRAFVADAPMRGAWDAAPAVLDCTPAESAQLAADAVTERDTVATDDRDALVGMWMSDDVLLAHAGLAPPVFSALDIAATGDEVIGVTLAVIRGRDPAEVFAALDPPVDVEAAGPFAMLASLRAVPVGEGRFAPVRVRYRALPLDVERRYDFALKVRMPSFYQTTPMTFRVTGDRLAVTAMDRGAARVYTYRRHTTDQTAYALYLARVGEVPFVQYPCLLRVVTDRRAPYVAMLDGFEEETFFGVLAERLDAEREVAWLSDLPADERPAAAKALGERIAGIEASPEMAALRAEMAKARPFGCVAGE